MFFDHSDRSEQLWLSQINQKGVVLGLRSGNEEQNKTIYVSCTICVPCTVSHVQHLTPNEKKEREEKKEMKRKEMTIKERISAGLELQILKGTHFKAILKGQLRAPRPC